MIVWLIEWPATKQYPLRYYAAGEPYVTAAYDATWFARKADAEAFAKAAHMNRFGGVVREHKMVDLPNVRSGEV